MIKYDVLIKDGFVVDGTGGSWYRADVGVRDGKIVEVCKNLPASGSERIIDAKGLVVCPGFFDMHTHSEIWYFARPRWEVKILQGVTSEINCQCGWSHSGPLKSKAAIEHVKGWIQSHSVPFDEDIDWTTLSEYMDRLEKFGGVSVNSAYLVGYEAVRLSVLGWEKRPPAKDELDKMKALVAEAMEEGAFGLSTGLQYPPQNFAETEELVELAKVVARYGGIYQSHIRRQGFTSDPRRGRAFLAGLRDTMPEAIRECIEIGERAGIPAIWSHAKIVGGWKHGNYSEEWLSEIDNARRRGVDVTMDTFSNPGKSGSWTTLFPQWAFEGGHEKLIERLKDPETRSKIRNFVKEILDGYMPMINFRETPMMMLKLEKNKDILGKTLGETAKMRGKNMVDLYLELIEESERPIFYGRTMTEEDHFALVKHPSTLFGTDLTMVPATSAILGEMRYMRYHCTYPRILSKLVREDRVLTLEEAVRKMTSAAANRLGITDRGLIRPGMWADITIFDPINVREGEPKPEGIPYVLVNGVITLDDGVHTGAQAGKILRPRYYKA
jgi:N-acyl-D-amino-acid deacylase